MTAMTEMPRYKSHKTVWALEIESVRPVDGHDACVLSFKDQGYAPRQVQGSIVARYMPTPGDFFVQYADGYESISPRKAFLEGYKPEESPKQHEGLPGTGYKPQGSYAVHEVNENKKLEEQVLRQVDMLQKDPHLAVDQRWLAIGRTAIEQGFMAINRAVFKPGRVKLLGDPEGTEGQKP
ncbi:hypothetical protein SAMN05216337_1017162 [Bradyrhizobium brasilense]|uniref:Acb2/Tad1 hairpin domain-containing protein n=1 Tax=Bradyrhizobium brasilense TaxID=1419277 RepID=A0A1G6Z264_9BRAD|nr:hypothetical protein [Bradyrhizobium brasilense]SDD96027.1 hypothetical protein SAMN05216337_1017162 [Bradyrhizobium brasilense]